MADIKALDARELLRFHAESLSELRERGILRSYNKPTGDLAEHLFCEAFSWRRESNSKKGVDAMDADNVRYQIKARQMIGKSRKLSAIRNLEDRQFDYLAGVLFNRDYTVLKGAIIPFEIVSRKSSSYSRHVNSHFFHLTEDVWLEPGVRDVTKELKGAFEFL